MRQYPASVKHRPSILQENSITCWEINENESTAVTGFQARFPSKSSFLAESKYASQVYKIGYCLCVHVHKWRNSHLIQDLCGLNEPESDHNICRFLQILFVQLNKQTLKFLDNLIYENILHLKHLLLSLKRELFLNSRNWSVKAKNIEKCPHSLVVLIFFFFIHS